MAWGGKVGERGQGGNEKGVDQGSGGEGCRRGWLGAQGGRWGKLGMGGVVCLGGWEMEWGELGKSGVNWWVYRGGWGGGSGFGGRGGEGSERPQIAWAGNRKQLLQLLLLQLLLSQLLVTYNVTNGGLAFTFPRAWLSQHVGHLQCPQQDY